MSTGQANRKPRLATVWLAGCSGCHMSLLDMDEWVIEMAQLVDVVFTPIADVKEYPEDVDIALVEGCVANEENLEMLLRVRERTKLLISFGDCAVTGNVTALRNPLGTAQFVLESCYVDKGDLHAQVPKMKKIVPVLLDRVRPLHEVVQVDRYIHGCPPSAPQIRAAIEALLTDPAGLDDSQVKFG
jgi:NAD-reducing hydrogenase small subunit